ncbi:ATP-binding protein [Sphingomonas sp. CARO-RG-8B-R24-01]|uniref:sensor histidine kinase n=1 Tax=Sphingomonas sp. CARO-RG-8B-R24-01 TaxID=2914831 RepID=UPI001F59305F|nr:ATP-binding protein [Sphingomonas sp. CARO-RG-8B-R24-01]
MVNIKPVIIVLFLLSVLMIGQLLYAFRLKRVAELIKQQFELRFDERERTARELQDNLLQGLHGLVLRFQIIKDQTSSTHRTSALIDDALARADAMLIEGRERVRNLRLGDGDLPRMLERLADDSCLDGKMRIKLLVPSVPRELRAGIAHELTEIAREAISNACRHADASRMQVSLIYAASYLRLVIEDNGRGIDPEALRQEHHGVAGMHERATKLQGDLTIQSRIGLGTILSIAVPARDAFANGAASSDCASL